MPSVLFPRSSLFTVYTVYTVVAPRSSAALALVHLSRFRRRQRHTGCILRVVCMVVINGRRSVSVRQLIASSPFMEYHAVNLPEHLLEGCDKGSWKQRNARFRRAVCSHFELNWFSCAGDGNCFFEAVCMLLRSVGVRV